MDDDTTGMQNPIFKIGKRNIFDQYHIKINQGINPMMGMNMMNPMNNINNMNIQDSINMDSKMDKMNPMMGMNMMNPMNNINNMNIQDSINTDSKMDKMNINNINNNIPMNMDINMNNAMMNNRLMNNPMLNNPMMNINNINNNIPINMEYIMRKNNINNNTTPMDMNNSMMFNSHRSIDLNNQKELLDMIENHQKFKNILENHGYEIIKKLYKTKYGELFLIFDKLNRNEENIYFLYSIESKSEKQKYQIEKEIDNLKKIDSKYIMKIIKHYFFSEKGKEIILIILNYYENNLFKIIKYESDFLNSRNIWKFFLQTVLGLYSLNLNNIMPSYLTPQNIYIDKENNIKIVGINMVLDIANDNENMKETLNRYYSPEIIKNEKNEKSIIWSLGCILYDLVFKKPAFYGRDKIDIENNVLKINYNLPSVCEKELYLILQKLICEKTKRLTIKELISEEIFKKKIIELNLFSEIIKDNVQGK